MRGNGGLNGYMSGWSGTGKSLPSARTAVVKAVAAKKARRSFIVSTMG